MKLWQKCPKCDGQGTVNKPSWVAGDQQEWSSTSTVHQCNLCYGRMVITTPEVKDPVWPEKRFESEYSSNPHECFMNKGFNEAIDACIKAWKDAKG